MIGDLLPGTRVNEFNRGLGKANLRRLVDSFNQAYAGKTDSHGTPIPLVTLPADFEFGDPLVTQDLRLWPQLSARRAHTFGADRRSVQFI
jgi:hypothetical protein